MKLYKRRGKGFTLVELLAAIVILGILASLAIAGVSHLISNARKENDNQNEKTLSMAAESYMQENKNDLPKYIGESLNVSASNLKKNHYLTEDLKNSYGESCMAHSYVRVYKISNTEYTYTPYVYCGDEVAPDENTVPEPTIDLFFTDSTHNKTDEVFNNVKSARIVINMTGGSTVSGTALGIESYSIAISTKSKATDAYQEVYNSGSLSVNRKTSETIDKAISDYVSLTNNTYVSVKVTVINTAGGIKELSTMASENGKDIIYNDEIAPICGDTLPIIEDNSWINKNANTSRTISIGCEDGEGSGCLRTTFSKSWPNQEESTGAEYSNIEIEDNNGNTTLCPIRVNVDVSLPTIEASAYKANDWNKGVSDDTNILTKTIKTSDSNSSVTISQDEYANLVGSSFTKWFNSTNYPYGIVYKFKISDNLHLAKWEWKTNAEIINKEDEKYKSTSIIESGSYPDTDFPNEYHGKTEDIITVNLTGEGYRYGVFTVWDAAGNSSSVTIYANIDRTAPSVPTIKANKYVSNTSNILGESYISKTWSNIYVNVSVDKNNEVDIPNLSGWKNYNYEVRKHGVSDNATASLTGIENHFNFSGSNKYEGKNRIRYQSCDNAGNCSNWSDNFEVWIDTIKPSCDVTATKTSDGSIYDGSWLNANTGNAKITATCRETNGDAGSGCYEGLIDGVTWKKTFEKIYDDNINTTSAGAIDINSGGKIRDIAGNINTCSLKTVKIDHDPPKCTKSGDNTKWTTSAVTLKWGCDDTNGSRVESGCDSTFSGGSATYNKNYYSTVTIASYNIKDVAGNVTICPAQTRNVYFDKTNPTFDCTVSNKKVSVTNKNDTGSGVKTTLYLFTTSSSLPSSSNPNWSTSTNKNAGSTCDKTYYGYAKVTDNVGNYTIKKCGYYNTSACCSESNPTGCTWVTSCREGTTFIYTSSSGSTYAGTVQHHLTGFNDKLYVLGKSGNMTKVYASSGNFYSAAPSNHIVWIYNNCIGGKNSVCPYTQCPG